MARKIGAKKAVEGLGDLQANVAELLDRFSGTELQQGLGKIALHGEWLLKAEARDQGWPKEAIDSTFTYAKLPPERLQNRGPSALFGFRKRGRTQPWAPGYVEWGKRTGKLVGESLATMYEFGTSKLRARPATRVVISAMRATYPQDLKNLLQGILSKYRT